MVLKWGGKSEDIVNKGGRLESLRDQSTLFDVGKKPWKSGICRTKEVSSRSNNDIIVYGSTIEPMVQTRYILDCMISLTFYYL